MATIQLKGYSSKSTLDDSHVTETASFDRPGGLGMSEEDERFLEADVRWTGLAKPFRIRKATVMCLIFNRMIGTGIFRTPALVFTYTHSVSVSMFWWCVGAVVGMCGIVVFMELGLTLPLYRFDGVDISVPRSGGELNYLKYIFEKPRYFSTCVFGIAFVLLGNVATNSISFGMSVLDAAGKSDIPRHDEVVRAIAVAVATFSCVIHGIWRQGGIYLNNILAVMKIAILIMMFILGCLAHAGVFGETKGAIKTHSEFTGRDADAYAYAESFLAILFAWGGFNQANYVMGEIDDPRRRYKWPAFSAVAIVSTLYILVNVAYFIVVPENVFYNTATNNNVAHRFFEYTLGRTSGPWASRAPHMLSAFMAISSLGNIVVMTYTAARVKQEIAKEGILPYRKFFASSVKSIRFSFWKAKKEALPEDIPLGALLLHLSVSLILLFATWPLAAKATYGLLVDLYSYTIDAIFGAFVGFGLLYMRLFSSRGWAKHSEASGFRIPHIVSVTCAFIYGIANLYPVAAKWVPPQVEVRSGTPWFITGTVAWSIMVAGALWWVGFRKVVPRLGRAHKGRYLLVTRKLWFHAENDYKVLEYEDIDFRWPPKEDGMQDTLLEEIFNADDSEVIARRHGDRRDYADGSQGHG